MKYEIIYCDPPWHYTRKQHSKTASTGGAISHYPTVPLPKLKTLNVQSIAADNSLCFMWITSPLMPQGLELMQAWGFEYKTVAFCWDKVKPNPGYYTMSQVELCIVGKRGTIPQPRGARNCRQFFSKKKTRHSSKPAEFRRGIENMFPEQRKIELFARGKISGWDTWGNQTDCSINLRFIDP